MKFIIACSILSLLMCSTNAQIITGIVYKEGSDSVIVGASVYYGGSLSGTITDNKGKFQLTAKSEQMPLTISCIGYYSTSVHYQADRPLIIRLKPKMEELHDVVIRVDGMSRQDEIGLFRREFLGLSYYARNCTINNIDDIDFFYDKKTQTFTATCDKPIIINNKALGYTISYYLDKFVKTSKQIYFAGNYIFKENEPTNEQAKIIRNRENAYDGSRMQLIRILWNNKLNESGFSLYAVNYTPLREKDIVVRDSANNKYLRLGGKVRIVYNGDTRALNTISCSENLSFIDSSGFYNAGLRWTGEMGQQRVGDLLPFDYQPLGNLESRTNAITSNIVIKKDKKKDDQSSKQLALFKSIVLVKDNPLNTEPVIRKWDQPVYYKFYGTCGNKRLDELLESSAQSIFKMVTDNSSLQIKRTADDKAVNFFIILNGSANNYQNILPADAVSYCADHPQSAGYYSYNENGFTSMVKLIDLKSIGDSIREFPVFGYTLRQHILNGLGFFNLASYKRESIFHNDVHLNKADSQTKASDLNIIEMLYRPDIKSGMTEQDLDNILNKEYRH